MFNPLRWVWLTTQTPLRGGTSSLRRSRSRYFFNIYYKTIKCEIISWWTVGTYCLLQSIEPDQPDAPGKSKKTSNRWSGAALRSGARTLVRGVSGTTQWCSWCPWFWNQDHFWLQHYSLLFAKSGYLMIMMIVWHHRVGWKTYRGRYCSWWLSCWREWYLYIHMAAQSRRLKHGTAG